MKFLSVYCLIALLVCLTSNMALGQEIDRCGVESERAEARVERYLTDDRLISSLELDGIDPPPAESLRVMTHAEDPEACADIALIKEEVERESFFYVAGDYYFRVTLPRPPSHWVDRDGIMEGPRGIFSVFNSERELIVMYLH